MKQFKGLMKKEWAIHKKQLIIPVWITIGIYVLLICGIIYGLIRGGKLQMGDIKQLNIFDANAMLYFVNTIITLIPIGLMMIFSMTAITNMLNEDFKNKCAIFHLAQPISLIKIIGAKLSVLFLATFGISFALALFNTMVVSIGFVIFQPVNIFYGFLGMFQSILVTITPVVFICSFVMLFASFSIKRPQIFIPFIIGIEFVSKILNALVHVNIPSIINGIMTLAFSKLTVNVFDSQKKMYQMSTNGEFDILKQSIQEMWLNLFDIINVYRLGLSVIFIVIAYFMYKRRDIA